MKKFKIMLNGQNFQMASEGVVKRHGFYTTRWVEANDPLEAELRAVDLVKNDSNLRMAVKNVPEDPPTILLDEVLEVQNFESTQVPGEGYTFYIED